MSLEDIVQLTITAQTATPTRPGFGTPLLAVSKVPAGWGPNRVRTFSKASELTDLGFAVTDPAYKMFQKAKSANPSPNKIKIGKRATGVTQSLKLKCSTAVQGAIYYVVVDGTPITYTVPGAATTATVATAIAALIDALASAAATSATDTVTVTPQTAGTLVNFASTSATFQITDNSADPGIAADLAAFAAEDVDWYGLSLDSNSKAEILAAAAWVQANKKLFGCNSSDYDCKNPASTTDVMYLLKASGYSRTTCLFSGAELLSYAGLAWLAEEFPFDPGGRTFAFKSLSGVSVDVLTAGETAAIEAKNGNHYQTVAGLQVTFPGKVSSGGFIDNVRGQDWLESEMKIQVFATLASAPKIPYTDKGANTVLATVKAVLRSGVRVGLLADDSNLTATAPKVADVDVISRAGRLLPDLTFTARLAGAIHTAKIAGTISV